MNNKLKIIIAGGGTGGHYYPALSFINGIKKNHKVEIIYFVTNGRIEEKKLPKDCPEATIIPVNLKGLKRPLYSFSNIKTLNNVIKEKNKIKKIIENFKPDFGFLTGGYVIAPVALALKSQKTPFYLHEQNSIMGITNKKLAKYAKKVFLSMPLKTNFKNYFLSGNPIRTPKTSIKREILKKYGITDISKKTILVFGGSLGSDKIDNIMTEIYPKCSTYNFIHVTSNLKKFNKFQNVFAYQYIDKIYELLAVCDGVISRAGATTIAEIKFYNIESILIPWRGAAEDHQLYNAKFLENKKLAKIVFDDNYNVNSIIKNIEDIKIKNKNFVWNYKTDLSLKNILNNIDEL